MCTHGMAGRQHVSVRRRGKYKKGVGQACMEVGGAHVTGMGTGNRETCHAHTGRVKAKEGCGCVVVGVGVEWAKWNACQLPV